MPSASTLLSNRVTVIQSASRRIARLRAQAINVMLAIDRVRLVAALLQDRCRIPVAFVHAPVAGAVEEIAVRDLVDVE